MLPSHPPVGHHAGSCAVGLVIGFVLAIALACVWNTSQVTAPGSWGATQWVASYVSRASDNDALGSWDVPSADVAASGSPLRSVGDRNDGAACGHHRALAAEVAAADEAEVSRSQRGSA